MHITHISLRNFRNYPNLSFSPGPKFNYLHGLNGSGKTNLLEAIYFLSHLRSFRRASRSNMVTEGKEGMYLRGEFLRDREESPLRLEAAISGADRRYKVNGKEESNLLHYLDRANTVVFFPESLRNV